MPVEILDIEDFKGDDPIWRYMSFTSFVDMVRNKTLHFTRVDQFKDLYDSTIEGLVSRISANHNNPSFVEQQQKYIDHFDKPTRETTFANCWHINDNESAALWELYSKAGQGVAIKSTIETLEIALSPHPEFIFVSTVSYSTDIQKWIKIMEKVIYSHRLIVVNPAIFVKDSSFKHEQELRAVLINYADLYHENITGIDVVVKDLNTLIKEIVVSPETKNWELNLLGDIARDYKINALVRPSSLRKHYIREEPIKTNQ